MLGRGQLLDARSEPVERFLGPALGCGQRLDPGGEPVERLLGPALGLGKLRDLCGQLADALGEVAEEDGQPEQLLRQELTAHLLPERRVSAQEFEHLVAERHRSSA